MSTARRLYTWLLRLLLPAVLARLLWRALRAPAYRQGLGERLGRGAPVPRADLWVHAVSVGEVQAAAPLLAHWLARTPPPRLLVTTATPTGRARLRALFGERIAHRYAPYDLPGAVAAVLDQARPRLLLVMETEIWPNLLAACRARGIPAILANARLSRRSARGYARWPRLTRETLANFDWIAAQGRADARRLRALGADPARLSVTGNLKFDVAPDPEVRARAAAWRAAWGQDRPVWVAASTHAGEDEPMLAAQRQLQSQDPRVLLVLVPRHPERFDQVAARIAQAGFALARLSRLASADLPASLQAEVLLGDTMGELPALLAAADAAFIGGSLVPHGGHNPIEAAVAGVPVLVGSHTFNFAAITERLVRAGGAVRVADASALARQLGAWFADDAARRQAGGAGARVVAANRGALERLLERLRARADAG